MRFLCSVAVRRAGSFPSFSLSAAHFLPSLLPQTNLAWTYRGAAHERNHATNPSHSKHRSSVHLGPLSVQVWCHEPLANRSYSQKTVKNPHISPPSSPPPPSNFLPPPLLLSYTQRMLLLLVWDLFGSRCKKILIYRTICEPATQHAASTPLFTYFHFLSSPFSCSYKIKGQPRSPPRGCVLSNWVFLLSKAKQSKAKQSKATRNKKK